MPKLGNTTSTRCMIELWHFGDNMLIAFVYFTPELKLVCVYSYTSFFLVHCQFLSISTAALFQCIAISNERHWAGVQAILRYCDLFKMLAVQFFEIERANRVNNKCYKYQWAELSTTCLFRPTDRGTVVGLYCIFKPIASSNLHVASFSWIHWMFIQTY